MECVQPRATKEGNVFDPGTSFTVITTETYVTVSLTMT